MALIHIDLDDTTVEFLNGVLNLHNACSPEHKQKKFHELDDWDSNGKFIEPFVKTEGLYLNLKIKENAVEIVRELNERHEVRFLTAYPTPLSAMEKALFVEKHFPFIGVRNTTLSWCKGDIKGDLLFDDSPAFVPKFEGLKVVFDKPYNKQLASDARVSSWLEFYDVICDYEKEGILIPSNKFITI